MNGVLLAGSGINAITATIVSYAGAAIALACVCFGIYFLIKQNWRWLITSIAVLIVAAAMIFGAQALSDKAKDLGENQISKVLDSISLVYTPVTGDSLTVN